MATILIVEDRWIDRTLLARALRSGGHQVVETSDGEDALRALTQHPAQLVISTILMPTIDGSAFVRRVREQPGLASTPVMFSTATYHEDAARALAEQCGVVDILTKPSAPDAIRAQIDAALTSRSPTRQVPIARSRVDREPLRLVRSTPVSPSHRFDMVKQRMAAIDESARQMVAERDLRVLLQNVCTDARAITLAQHAVVGLLADHAATRQTLFASGVSRDILDGMTPPAVGSFLLNAVVAGRHPVRVRNPSGKPETVGLPRDHPRVSSLLTVPIASPIRVYGWLSLRNKLGTDEFSEDDEHAVVAFGAYAGIAYENLCLMDDLRRRIVALEGELRQRSTVQDALATVLRHVRATRLSVSIRGTVDRLIGDQDPDSRRR